MITLSTIGSWALIAYIVGAAFYIAHRTMPGEDHD